jgi:CTP-dependent riboflavin kinase
MRDSMSRTRDNNSGQCTQTAELAGEFDVTRPTADRWLCDLGDEGEVTRREVGQKLLWVPGE